MNFQTFIVGRVGADHVAVDVLGYERAASSDPFESNWLRAEISVSAGQWHGKIAKAFFTTHEIQHFRVELEKLAKGSIPFAELNPMEHNLILKLSGDGQGNLEVSGVAFDNPGGFNALAFNWVLDTSCLPELVRQLKELEKTFPIIVK